MATTIESLEFELRTSAESAESGLNRLIETLGRLKQAAKGGLGLSAVIKQINGIGDAAKNIDLSAMSNLYAASEAIAALSNVSGLKISSSIATQLDAISTAANTLAGVSFTPISDLADALAALSGVGNINIPSVGAAAAVSDVSPAVGGNLDVQPAAADNVTNGLGKMNDTMSQFHGLWGPIKDAASSALNKIKKIIRSFWSSITQGFTEGMMVCYQYSKTIGGVFADSMDSIATSFKYLNGSIGAMAAPLFNMLAPAIDWLVDKFVDLLNVVNQVIAYFSGADTWTKAVKVPVEYAEAVDGAVDANKELKKSILSIDEINPLSGNINSDSGKGSSLTNGYAFEETPLDREAIGKIIDKLKTILSIVGLIGAGIAAWKVSSGLMNGIKQLSSLLNTIASSSGYAIAVGLAFTVAGFTLEFSGIKDAIEDGLDKINFAEIIAGGLLGTGGAAMIGSGIAGATGAAVGAGIAGVVAGLPAAFVGIYDACVNGINWLNGVLIPVGTTAAGAGVGAILATAGTAITPGIGTLIGLAVGLLIDGIILIVQNWDSIVEWYKGMYLMQAQFFMDIWNGTVEFMKSIPDRIIGAFARLDEWVKSLPDRVKQKISEIGAFLGSLPEQLSAWFSGLADNITTWFSNLWQPVKDFDWSNLGNNIGQWFGNAFKTAYTFVTQTVPERIGEIGNAIKEALGTFFTSTLPNFFTQTIPQVVQSVADFFKTLPERLGNIFVSIRDGIVNIGKSILDGIVEGLSSGWSAITDFAGGLVDGFKSALGIHSPSRVFYALGEYTIAGYNNAVRNEGAATLGIVNRWAESFTGVTPTISMAVDTSALGEYDSASFARGISANMMSRISGETSWGYDDSITVAVSQGVADANEEQNTLLREEIGLLRQLLAKDSSVVAHVSTDSLITGLERKNRRDGRTVIPVGV